MKTELINEIIQFIKDRNISETALSSLKEMNLMNFLHEVQFGELGNYSAQLSKISYPNISKIPLTTADLLFLAQHTDINKFGTYENNSNQTFSEFIFDNIKQLSHDMIHFNELKNLINEKTDFTNQSGFQTNYLEIALTSDLFNFYNQDKIIKSYNVNQKTGFDFNGGMTALQRILHSPKLISATHNFKPEWIEVLANKTQFSEEDLTLLIDKKDQLSSHFNTIMQAHAKESYIKNTNPFILIKRHIIEGHLKGVFSDNDLIGFIDGYFDKDYSVNLINKQARFKEFSDKGNLMIKLLKEIKEIPYVLQDRILAIECLPASNTFHLNETITTDSEGNQSILIRKFEPNQVHEKRVSDDVLFYLAKKADESLKNASTSTRDPRLDKNLISQMITGLRNISSEHHKNKLKN